MDQIFVKNLLLSGRHGHLRNEQDKPQLFKIDITCTIDSSKVSETDSIEDTADYRKIRQAAQDVIEGPSLKMLEKIADTIASRVLKDPHIMSATVKIQKEQIWNIGIPGAIITRQKK